MFNLNLRKKHVFLQLSESQDRTDPQLHKLFRQNAISTIQFMIIIILHTKVVI